MRKVTKQILIIYFAVVLLCAALIIGSDFLGPSIGGKLVDVAADGLKISLSALVGALSATLGIKDA